MAFKSMKEVREFLDETERRMQEVPDGNFFKLADKLELDVLRDFAKSDLSNTDLSNGNLENADLSHANLSNANLSGANLKNANLSHATLLKADLSGTDLSGASLLNANLQDTNFSEAKYNSTTKFPEGFSSSTQRMAELQHLESVQKFLRAKSKLLGDHNLPVPDEQLGLLDRQAIVEQAILPGQSGRVRFLGTRWFAHCDKPVTIALGELVDVIGRKGSRLLVRPVVETAAQKHDAEDHSSPSLKQDL